MTIHRNSIEQDADKKISAVGDGDALRYARCISASKRVRWTVEEVIQGRTLEMTQNFLPNGFAKAAEFQSLSSEEMRLISQIQGRTYANMFGLLERYVNAKILELSRDHWFSDQTKLEALIRFSDEEIKHQHLFTSIEGMIASAMPNGYDFTPQPNPVAKMILGKSTWAVLGLTLMVELVTQAHYRESIAHDDNLSPLYRDVFRYHWMEECQHATLDELEWRREDAKLSASERDAAIDELIELAAAIESILQDQATADAEYFRMIVGRPVAHNETDAIVAGILKAYRWQYIFSGAENARFSQVIKQLTTGAQKQRFDAALQSFV